ncbi:HD-GYP domain-containing protein [Gracilimonas sp. BCB1]|uniref:HD-GYP domain-containing protein n=1 Tax=Gracilimonas sp. BCB1 TaxID=3152362 RepID=UPI0032D98A8E
MIKDVRSYIHTVGNRLSKAFSMEAFGTEQQLEFWELSAEHLSRKRSPSFSDIVNWMDLLYRAPVHFVYRLQDGKLVLDRRHVLTKNILRDAGNELEPHKQTPQQKEYLKDFEYQLQNLEKKMSMDEVFKEQGITSHSIGQCEHIPLFKKDGEQWGIYCAGPYTKSPDQITPKLSIVGRLLANWLITLDEEESNPQREYEQKIENVVSDLGSGQLNTEGIAQIILRYVVHGRKVASGCIVEFTPNGHKLLVSVGMKEKLAGYFTAGADKALYENKGGELKVTEFGQEFLKQWGKQVDVEYFTGEHHSGFLMVEKTEGSGKLDIENLLKEVGLSFANLFDYRHKNENFSDQLMDGYYKMLRAIEKSREKTRFHTPRMVAFVQRFGMFFGLEDDEMEIITKTAKLHDIGYVGAISIEPGKTIGGELSHPIIGANMVEHLSIDKDVLEGIRTHHEWVNGNGSPSGLNSETIPWTGKIIGLFEFVVDFVESNAGDDSKTNDEWLELLSRNLMERADIEFDMVLIPTAIQLLQALGWQECVRLGVEE